jgi:hypothetical protein
MIQMTYENEAVGCTQVKEWFRQFREGQASVESDEFSQRLSMWRNQLIIDSMCFAMLDNQTIREISYELGLTFGLAQSILTRFGHEWRLNKICPKTADSQVPPCPELSG